MRRVAHFRTAEPSTQPWTYVRKHDPPIINYLDESNEVVYDMQQLAASLETNMAENRAVLDKATRYAETQRT